MTGDRVGTNEIMRRTGLGKVSVWRWQERYVAAGVDGLLRDKTRPSRIPKLAEEKVAEVIRRTQEEAPPDGGTHWTVRAMAAATGVSRAKVHVIWREAGLVPHRWRQFKLSNDPAFALKVEDVVGLYVDPPERAVVLSIDEKSPIQALDRTQPGLPMKKGRLGTMTHDYKRNGTTTLLAALNVLDGSFRGQRLMLTGGSGRAGRHVVQHLVVHGDEVLSIDPAPPDHPQVRTLETDSTDPRQVFVALSSDMGLRELEPSLRPQRLDAVARSAAVPRIVIPPTTSSSASTPWAPATSSPRR